MSKEIHTSDNYQKKMADVRNKSSWRIHLAWFFTGIWCFSWCFYLYFKWPFLQSARFNEWGDFFSGISAPLAFLWLVVGYYQQGEEVSLNTLALMMQNEELAESVKHQNEISIATKTEASILSQQFDIQNRIMELRTKPSFVLYDIKLKTPENEKCVYEVNIINEGCNVRSVQVSGGSSTLAFKIEHQLIQYWPKEKVVNFKLNITHYTDSIPGAHLIFIFSYSNSEGEDRKKNYDLCFKSIRDANLKLIS